MYMPLNRRLAQMALPYILLRRNTCNFPLPFSQSPAHFTNAVILVDSPTSAPIIAAIFSATGSPPTGQAPTGASPAAIALQGHHSLRNRSRRSYYPEVLL